MVNMIAQDQDATPAADGGGSASLAWLAELPAQERIVLEFRYGIAGREGSWDEIALELGVSQSTVRRLEKRALNRARRLLVAS